MIWNWNELLEPTVLRRPSPQEAKLDVTTQNWVMRFSQNIENLTFGCFLF